MKKKKRLLLVLLLLLLIGFCTKMTVDYLDSNADESKSGSNKIDDENIKNGDKPIDGDNNEIVDKYKISYEIKLKKVVYNEIEIELLVEGIDFKVQKCLSLYEEEEFVETSCTFENLYSFINLKEDTNYNIYSYIMDDNEKIESNSVFVRTLKKDVIAKLPEGSVIKPVINKQQEKDLKNDMIIGDIVISGNPTDYVKSATLVISYPENSEYIYEYEFDGIKRIASSKESLNIDKNGILTARVRYKDSILAMTINVTKIDNEIPLLEINAPEEFAVHSRINILENYTKQTVSGSTKGSCNLENGDIVTNSKEISLGVHQITCTVTTKTGVIASTTKEIDVIVPKVLKAVPKMSETIPFSGFLGTPVPRVAVTSVSFQNTLDKPEGFSDIVYDVSDVGDTGEYLLWFKENSPTDYSVVIGREGKIYLNSWSNYMFYQTKITSIDFTNVDASQVNSMVAFFSEMPNLEYVNFGDDFYSVNLKSAASIFNSTPKLKTVEFGEAFTIENSTNLFRIFYSSGIESIYLGEGFVTDNVSSYASMFENATSLKNVKYSNKVKVSNTANITNIYLGTSSLEKIDLTEFDILKISNIKALIEVTPIDVVITVSDDLVKEYIENETLFAGSVIVK